MEDTSKIINITGTNNKYLMNKLIVENNNSNDKIIKKRVITNTWSLSDDIYKYSEQIKLIYDISNNNFNSTNNKSKIAIQEIQRKISGYKQQDKIKNKYDKPNFLTFESIIIKMIECELKCRYCLKEMFVLYDISRESRQWSVDRIDNNLGHNIDNYHLACLECNLKRRRRTDEKFLFTKQLKLVKKE